MRQRWRICSLIKLSGLLARVMSIAIRTNIRRPLFRIMAFAMRRTGLTPDIAAFSAAAHVPAGVVADLTFHSNHLDIFLTILPVGRSVW